MEALYVAASDMSIFVHLRTASAVIASRARGIALLAVAAITLASAGTTTPTLTAADGPHPAASVLASVNSELPPDDQGTPVPFELPALDHCAHAHASGWPAEYQAMLWRVARPMITPSGSVALKHTSPATPHRPPIV